MILIYFFVSLIYAKCVKDFHFLFPNASQHNPISSNSQLKQVLTHYPRFFSTFIDFNLYLFLAFKHSISTMYIYEYKYLACAIHICICILTVHIWMCKYQFIWYGFHGIHLWHLMKQLCDALQTWYRITFFTYQRIHKFMFV